MNLDVSVVVPCYNGAAFVRKTVESALAESELAIEVVVVDDGSTDDSATVVAALAEADSRLRLVRQDNSGVAAARNAGLAAIDRAGTCVLFLDADDVLEPGALRALWEVLDQHSEAPAVAGTCFRIDEDGRRPEDDAPSPSFDTYHVTDDGVELRRGVDRLGYWDVVATNPIWTPGQCLIRRGVLDDHPFNGAFSPCEDWDLWMRISAQAEILTLGERVLGYRDHAASASKSYGRMWEQRRKLLLAQAQVVPNVQRGRLERAYYFALYRYSEILSLAWARDTIARRRPVDAARFALRAVKHRVDEYVARRRDAFDRALQGAAL